MESVWIFKLGLWFLMNSISKTKQSNLPWHFLKILIGFLPRDGCYRKLSRDVNRSPNICVQQCVDEGFGLCTRHNLHRADHMRNSIQRIADSLLMAWFLWVGDLAPISCSQCRLQCGENLMAKIAQLLPNRTSGHLIFEWKTNSYCATIIGVSFRCACRRISKNKIIDSGINKACRVVETTENGAQFDAFCIKSLCGRRFSVFRIFLPHNLPRKSKWDFTILFPRQVMSFF